MLKALLNNENGRCNKCGCTAGCIAIIIVIILIVIVLKYFSGPNSQKINVLPTNFPKNVPLYKVDQATKIEYSSDKDQNSLSRALVFLSKYFAAQFLSEEKRPKISKIDDGIKIEQEIKFSDIWQAIKKPLAEESIDHITIEWDHLGEEFNQVKTYYISNLLVKNFEIKKRSDDKNFYSLTFLREKIGGDLEIEFLEKIGKLNIRIVVDYPSE